MPKPAKTDLQQIPGIGPNMEQHLLRLGYDSIASLRGQDAEVIYQRECAMLGVPVDRCALYVYRLAVYFADHKHPDPQKLRWWYWKDALLDETRGCRP